MSNNLEEILKKHIAWWESIDRESVRIERLEEFYAQDARFRDPFNDVTGIAKIHAVLIKCLIYLMIFTFKCPIMRFMIRLHSSRGP